MGAQHTPGPWEAEPVSSQHGNERPWVGRLDENRFSAMACGETQDEAVANARLIAAAPDGLAANKAFVAAVESGAGVQDRMTLDQAYTEVLKQYGHGIAKAYDAAYAAIEKAEGR